MSTLKISTKAETVLRRYLENLSCFVFRSTNIWRDDVTYIVRDCSRRLFSDKWFAGLFSFLDRGCRNLERN